MPLMLNSVSQRVIATRTRNIRVLANISIQIKKESINDSFLISGRRDSNSRQPAWKADALPTELLPHKYSIVTRLFYNKTFLKSRHLSNNFKQGFINIFKFVVKYF